ncbi:MAG: hypothetical protein AAGG01_10170, partial [Planctomycetota bacterium]
KYISILFCHKISAKEKLILIAKEEGRDPLKDPAIARVTKEINEVSKNLMLAEETSVGVRWRDREPQSAVGSSAAEEGVVHASEDRARSEGGSRPDGVLLVPVPSPSNDQREEPAVIDGDRPGDPGADADGDDADEPPGGAVASDITPVTVPPLTIDEGPMQSPERDEGGGDLTYVDSRGVRHVIQPEATSAAEVRDLIREALPPGPGSDGSSVELR